MRLVTFRLGRAVPRIGVIHSSGVVLDLFAGYAALVHFKGVREPGDAYARAASDIPGDMIDFFAGGPPMLDKAKAVSEFVDRMLAKGEPLQDPGHKPLLYNESAVKLLAPVPRPLRIRDYLTYEAHASGAGLKVPPAFSEMPICYKGNPFSVIGPEEEIIWPAYTEQLDYELEIGFYIGKPGRNIPAESGDDYIAGITIFNDVSARDIQFREMSLQIGPSKGKDFCNVMGPCVVTMDEIDEFNLRMRARINGETWSEGTSKDRKYSFGQLVAWASYCEDILPGEFIAVGTVGGGCGYELNRWIKPGDLVELEVDGVGVLRNRVGNKEKANAGAGLPSYKMPPRTVAHT